MKGQNNPASTQYIIRIRGHLDLRWAEWFDSFRIEYRAGDTLLSGSVPDQPALHGVLAKIRDLGVTILLVENIDIENEDNP